MEGQAAATYWTHLASLLPAGAGFKGRVTREAGDPVNQALNYVYGMLYGEVWRALVKAGLDPYFGIMHGSERDQGSMVFDLIEEFRAPFADRLVVALVSAVSRSGHLVPTACGPARAASSRAASSDPGRGRSVGAGDSSLRPASSSTKRARL